MPHFWLRHCLGVAWVWLSTCTILQEVNKIRKVCSSVHHVHPRTNRIYNLYVYIYMYNNQLVWAKGCAVFLSRAERLCLSDRSQVATALWAKPSQRNHQTRRSGPKSGQRRTDFWSWNKASSQLEKNTSWGLWSRTYSLYLLECLQHCGHVTSQVVLTSSICGWNHCWSERMKIELLFFRCLIAGSFSFGGEPEFVTICVFRFEERIHDWKLLGSPGRATSSVHVSSCASIFSCFQLAIGDRRPPGFPASPGNGWTPTIPTHSCGSPRRSQQFHSREISM